MNKRVFLSDIIVLAIAAVALVLLWYCFSPPVSFVVACLVVGALLPILYRLVRKFLPKSLWFSLPIILVLIVFRFLNHRFSTVSERPGVLFVVFGSALFTAGCAVEFSLRPFFPLKSSEKQT